MEEQTIKFTLERETKNTVRYMEDSEGKPPIVGTIYLQKWALGTNPPKALKIVVSEDE